MEMYYEANYWIRTRIKEIVCIGTIFYPLSEKDLKDLGSVVEKIAPEYNEMLSFNSHFELEDNAEVVPYISKKNDTTIVINLWLADSEPKLYSKYLGKNPTDLKQKLTIEAHCWNLCRPAHIVDSITNLAFMLNKYRKLNEDFPDNCLLRFMLFMDDLYHYPYIYAFFVPYDMITICREKLVNDKDKLMLEFCGIYRAHYFTILKSKYYSTVKITEEDIEMIR